MLDKSNGRIGWYSFNVPISLFTPVKTNKCPLKFDGWFGWFFLSKKWSLVKGHSFIFRVVSSFVFDLPPTSEVRISFINSQGTLRTITSRVLFHLKNWIHFFPWNVPGWFFLQPQAYMCQLWKFLPKKLTRLDSELPSWQLKHAKLPAAKLGIKRWSSKHFLKTYSGSQNKAT